MRYFLPKDAVYFQEITLTGVKKSVSAVNIHFRAAEPELSTGECPEMAISFWGSAVILSQSPNVFLAPKTRQ
jgi:hypothetical protein